MDKVIEFWPIIVAFLLTGVWLVRGEQKINSLEISLKTRASTEALNGLLQMTDEAREVLEKNHLDLQNHIREFYATKVEVARIDGAISGLSVQMTDLRRATQSVENKLDTLLMSKSMGDPK